LKEETQIIDMVKAACEKRDPVTLKSALALAAKFSPPINHPLVVNAEAMFLKWQVEGDINSGLIKAIAAKDRSKLDDLLAQAEKVQLDSDETKQAKSLRNRMRDEDAAIAALRKATVEQNLTVLKECLEKCAILGLENAEVDSARKLLEKVLVEIQILQAIQTAVANRELNALIESLARATALGLTESKPEIAEAVALRRQLEKQKSIIAELKTALDSRSVSNLDIAIAAATAMGLTSENNDTVLAAVQMRESLLAEARVRSALESAIATNDEKQLNDSLEEAAKLGLKGTDVDAAYEAARKFGVRNVLRDKLAVAAAGDSIEEIDAALAIAQTNGMMNTPEAASCLAKRSRLAEQRHLVRQLVLLTNDCTFDKIQALNRWIADCVRMDLQLIYPKQIEDARAKCHALEEEREVRAAMDRAYDASDLEALSPLIDEATAKGYTETMQYGDEKREILAKRVLILASLDDAMRDKDKARVSELLAQAKAIDLTGEKIRLAGLFANREKLIANCLDDLKRAQRLWDMRLLNDALDRAIELGLRTHEVTLAEQIRAADLAQQECSSRLTATVQEIALKANTGLEGSDLQPLIEAISFANSVRIFIFCFS
jgi:hypothetical protein